MQATSQGFNPVYGEDAPDEAQIAALSGVTVLEFGAPWCGHCMAARPAVESLLRAHPEWRHIKVYDGKGKALGRAFGVKLWPTLILLRDGKEAARVVRPLRADDLAAWCD
jgi:thioredoxin 1